MIAEMLAEAGLDVIVADRRAPTRGSTIASTALVQYEIDTPLRRAEAEDRRRAMRCARGGARVSRSRRSARSCASADSRRKRATRSILRAIASARARCGAKRSCARRPASKRCFSTRAALRDRFGISRDAALLGFDNLTINPRDIAARPADPRGGFGARLFAPVDIVDISRSRSSSSRPAADGPQIRSRYLVLASGYEFPRIVPKKGHRITTTWAFATAPQRRRLWPEECLIWEASTPYLYARTTAGRTRAVRRRRRGGIRRRCTTKRT